jgi:hypothetical protein
MDLPDILVEQNKPDMNIALAIDDMAIDDGNVAFNNYLFLLVGVIAWYYYFAL